MLVLPGVLPRPSLNSGDSDEENRWDRPVLLSDARECLTVLGEGCKDCPGLSVFPVSVFVCPIEIGHSLYFQALVRLGYKFPFRACVGCIITNYCCSKEEMKSADVRSFYSH